MIRAWLALAALACAGPVAAATASAPPSEPTVTGPQRTAAFTAAGFHQVKTVWQACGDPGSEGYQAGSIDEVTDINGDRRPEAVITEGSTYCYGNTGAGFSLVSQQADGSWKLIYAGPGVPEFLETTGTDGWADLEVGGPGLCFAVLRWNGAQYVQNRFEYEGKPCRP